MPRVVLLFVEKGNLECYELRVPRVPKPTSADNGPFFIFWILDRWPSPLVDSPFGLSIVAYLKILFSCSFNHIVDGYNFSNRRQVFKCPCHLIKGIVCFVNHDMLERSRGIIYFKAVF